MYQLSEKAKRDEYRWVILWKSGLSDDETSVFFSQFRVFNEGNRCSVTAWIFCNVMVSWKIRCGLYLEYIIGDKHYVAALWKQASKFFFFNNFVGVKLVRLFFDEWKLFHCIISIKTLILTIKKLWANVT